MTRPEDNEVTTVNWNEKTALSQVYRKRVPRFAKATEEEREEEWKKLDGRFAKRLIKTLIPLFKLPKYKKRRKQAQTSELTIGSYNPPNIRLLLSKNLQLHNVHYDKDLLFDPRNNEIAVFCDVARHCSDYFLSDGFHYRIGRPFRIGIEFDCAAIPNTVSDVYKLPSSLRLFAHSEQGTCICDCEDCAINPECKCARLSTIINKGNTRLKNETLFLYDSVHVNCEDVDALVIGCGQACKCYQHGKCERNVDLLLSKQPKLEVYREDLEMNFRVRTLQSLLPGDFVAEFTGHLETRAEIMNHPKAPDYAFQLVFEDSMRELVGKMINGFQDHPTYTEFKDLYNDLTYYKKNANVPEIFIQPFNFGNVSQFMSHGCLPNCHVVRVIANHIFPQFHRLLLFADHYIQAGSELFINYGDAYVERLQGNCRCKTLLCPDIRSNTLVVSATNPKPVEDYLKDVVFPITRTGAICNDKQLEMHIMLNPGFTNGQHLRRCSRRIKNEPTAKAEENQRIYRTVTEHTQQLIEQTASLIRKYPQTSDYRREQKQRSVPRDAFRQIKIKTEQRDIIEVHSTHVISLSPSSHSISSSAKRSPLCVKNEKRTVEDKEDDVNNVIQQEAHELSSQSSSVSTDRELSSARPSRTLRRRPAVSYKDCDDSHEDPMQKRKRPFDTSNKNTEENTGSGKSKKPHITDEDREGNVDVSSISSIDSSPSPNNDEKNIEIVCISDASGDMETSNSEGDYIPEITTEEESENVVEQTVERPKKKRNCRKALRNSRSIEQSKTAARKGDYTEQKKVLETVLPSKPLDLQSFKIPKKAKDPESSELPLVEVQVDESLFTPDLLLVMKTLPPPPLNRFNVFPADLQRSINEMRYSTRSNHLNDNSSRHLTRNATKKLHNREDIIARACLADNDANWSPESPEIERATAKNNGIFDYTSNANSNIVSTEIRATTPSQDSSGNEYSPSSPQPSYDPNANNYEPNASHCFIDYSVDDSSYSFGYSPNDVKLTIVKRDITRGINLDTISMDTSATSLISNDMPTIVRRNVLSDVNLDVVSMDISATSLCSKNEGGYSPNSDSSPHQDDFSSLTVEYLHNQAKYLPELEEEPGSFSISQIPLPIGPPPRYAVEQLEPLPMEEEVSDEPVSEKEKLIEEKEAADRDYLRRIEQQRELNEIMRIKLEKKEKKRQRRKEKKALKRERKRSKRRSSSSSGSSARSVSVTNRQEVTRSPSVEILSVRYSRPRQPSESSTEGFCVSASSSIEWLDPIPKNII